MTSTGITPLRRILHRLPALGFLAAAALPVCAARPFLAAQTPPTASANASTQASANTSAPSAAPIPTEEDLRRRLIGKTWYLRGNWLDDSLHFSMRGQLPDHANTGSYTLCLVRIEKVSLTHKHLQLDGARYALHFLGALPYEDPQKSVEEIRITPKRKTLRILVDREPVVKPKKSRADKKHPSASTSSPGAPSTVNPAAATPSAASSAVTSPKAASTGSVDPAATLPGASSMSAADSTDSPAVAAQTLDQALQRILAPSLDAALLASLPDYWQLYYAAQRSGHEFVPGPGVLPSSTVDHSARLLKAIDPPSNSYAQANGIAGRALYRVVVQASGKPGRIAILRPIGFGLDESAVASIQAASFTPAVHSGQPVAEALDLAVMFRIYSSLTAAPARQSSAPHPVLPGPYSVK